jgi:hypothetical protein
MTEADVSNEAITGIETVSDEVDPQISDALILRLAFFDADIQKLSTKDWLSAAAIARSADASANQVRRIAEELGIDQKVKIIKGKERDYYPPYAQVVITEEIWWKRTYRSLPTYLGVSHIAENIGRSYGYTQKLLRQFDIRPTRMVWRGETQYVPRYHKRALNTLREYNMTIPFDDTHYNLKQLELITGEDREWIERRLAEAGIEPETRRNGINGHSLTYYPSDSLKVLKEAAENRPSNGDDWLTAYAIEAIVGKSDSWVKLRLNKYANVAKSKLDANRVPRLHYPTDVLTALINEVDAIEDVPETEDFQSTHQLAKALGKSMLWVENRIGPFSELGELRKDKKGRLHTRYPREVYDQLVAELEVVRSYPEAEEYLTLSGLAAAIGRTDYWVKRRIGRIGIIGEVRRDGVGRLREYYSPSAAQILADLDH